MVTISLNALSSIILAVEAWGKSELTLFPSGLGTVSINSGSVSAASEGSSSLPETFLSTPTGFLFLFSSVLTVEDFLCVSETAFLVVFLMLPLSAFGLCVGGFRAGVLIAGDLRPGVGIEDVPAAAGEVKIESDAAKMYAGKTLPFGL